MFNKVTLDDEDYCKIGDKSLCLICTESYSSSLEFIESLFQEVKKDFPLLSKDDCDLKILGGRSYKGIIAIIFHANEIPKEYRRINVSAYNTHYPYK